jgi:hypothetical protein
MAIDNSISQDLYDLLVTQNFDPETTDEQGQPSQPGEGKIFTFDYTGGTGKNYGTAVLVIGDENDLMFFFGDNLGQSMEEPDKSEWFQFIQQLKQFATQHRFTWSMRDLNKFKHTMAGMAAIKEGLFEGYYGNRKVSYAGEPTEARLMIKHNRILGETDARFRYVESLFIETADNERFKLPFKNLAGGRAMLEHVRQGGKPYDIRGGHISEMVSEIATLARFNRASNNRMLEGVTQAIVTEAQTYYKSLRESLKHLAGSRGYNRYFESWTPADIGEQEGLVENIKTMFIEQTLDSRIEDALPLLAKIQQQGTKMKEADIFEAWVNTMSEGTWALPDTPETQTKLDELMSKELIVGPDATNATELLYDLVGDDELFDRLHQLAEQDPRANIWDDTDVQQRLEELGIQMPTPVAPTEPTTDATVASVPAEPPVQEQAVEEGQLKRIAALYNDWLNSEYAPLDSDAGDDKILFQKAREFLYGDVDSDVPDDKIDAYAEELARAYDGGMYEADNISTFEGQDDPMNYNAAITGSYYESDELARIKSLALLK